MFFSQPQPLKLNNVDEHVLHEIDDALQMDIDKEEILRKVWLNGNFQGCPPKIRFTFTEIVFLVCRCFLKRDRKPRKSWNGI